MRPVSDLPAGDFWAITSYFNPVRYRRRLSNYKIFRQLLKVPLVAVELSYDDNFELQDGDADILIRLRGGAVLWQKERLLNLALNALPKVCTKVAWLDCDIIFCDDQWAEGASRLLERIPVIQLFKNVQYLARHWTPGSATVGEFSRVSIGFVLWSGLTPAECLGRAGDRRLGSGANGLAWAARRELLDRHGFYDACITGGGDRAFSCGVHALFDSFMDGHDMNEHQRAGYLAWANPLHESTRGETSFVEGDILHLWHGDMSRRAGLAKHQGLQRFGFDPSRDIAIQANGAWGWSSAKPELHNYVRSYFESRQEDG